MIVVADSGPPHYLILLGEIDLLHRFYEQVAIPQSVVDELRAESAPTIVSSWFAHPPEWVAITAVPQAQIDSITDDLDLGERAAIALAGAIQADLLLIDDAAGRAEAARRSLRVTGTLGVLRAGAEQGLIDVPAMLARLRTTSFYVDDTLINAIFSPWLQP
jgi:predicted nucleic acid-binding protein